MAEYLAKQKAVAKLLDGEVIDSSERVAVCVKGSVNGFPATLEAFMPSWPFSTTYIIETHPKNIPSQAKILITPRLGRGFLSFFLRAFLFESRSKPVHDKKLESRLLFDYDNQEPALRFLKYPEVPETLLSIERNCHLRELVIKTNEGLYLVQARSFKALELDLCQATFKFLSELAQVTVNLF